MGTRPAALSLVFSIVKWVTCVAWVACASVDLPRTISKADAANLKGVGGDGEDLCYAYGWYNDQVCDDFCPAVDRDCLVGGCFGLDVSTCTSTAGCTRWLPPPVYNPNINQAPSMAQMPSDICRPNDVCDNVDAINCTAQAGCEPALSASRLPIYCRRKSGCNTFDEATCATHSECVPIKNASTNNAWVTCAPRPQPSDCYVLTDAKTCKDNAECQPVYRQVVPQCTDPSQCVPPVSLMFERCVPKLS